MAERSEMGGAVDGLELAGRVVVTAPIAAWTWHSSPRAVTWNGRTFWGSVTRTERDESGIIVSAYEHATGAVTVSPIILTVGAADDHCNPSVCVRPDGRIVIGAAGHTSDRLWAAVSSAPGEVGAWDAPVAVRPGGFGRYSYTQMTFLAEEGPSGRLYWFFRARGYAGWLRHKLVRLRGYANWWAYATSDDFGETWSDARILWRERGVNVPYTHVVSNGRDTIFLSRSDTMDRVDPANRCHVMACRLQRGVLSTTNGERICGVDGLPLTDRTRLDLVYDSAAPDGRPAFNLDLALDAAGEPVIAFSTIVRSDDIPHGYTNRYHVARHVDGGWVVEDLADGGPSVYGDDTHPHYSGAMAIDRADTDRVLLGVVDARGNEKRCDVQLWRRDPRTGTWGRRATITPPEDGDRLSFRPTCPEGETGPVRALWLAGRYQTYKRWSTSVRLLVEE